MAEKIAPVVGVKKARKPRVIAYGAMTPPLKAANLAFLCGTLRSIRKGVKDSADFDSAVLAPFAAALSGTNASYRAEDFAKAVSAA